MWFFVIMIFIEIVTIKDLNFDTICNLIKNILLKFMNSCQKF